MSIKPVYHVQEGLGNGGMNFAPNPLAAYQGIADRGTSYYEPGREAQLDALSMYRNQALGQGGPSAAEQQLRMQSGINQRAALQQAAMSRGGNVAGMYSGALQAGAGMQNATNQQAALLRAQEQLAARQMYGEQANQLAQLGYGYDSLASQTLLGGQRNEMDWRLGNRELDLNEQAQRRQLWGQLAAGGMGVLSAGLGAMGGA